MFLHKTPDTAPSFQKVLSIEHQKQNFSEAFLHMPTSFHSSPHLLSNSENVVKSGCFKKH